ncbi:sensor histidine kinase [Halobaculum gomorrense]|uniref:histidine kinase n=1 Tax=Halobaculum gomorrense TaxID=43928 RepID=A0A1M5RYY6_9EURY|nr:ATP-binding protein [Halobaculum gomorrense]SHH31466.1 PAS domain S-box-containing protein [Halobaculum gomorrense]
MNSDPIRGLVVETLSDGIVVVNEDEAVLDCNPAARRTLGLSSDRAIGEPLESVAPDLASVVDEADLEPDSRPTGQSRRTDRDTTRDDPVGDASSERAVVGTILGSGDGENRQYEVAVSSFEAESRSGRILSLRDVTDRQRHRRRLGVLNRVLRHDLRNKMNVILGYAEVLEERLQGRADRRADQAPLGDPLSGGSPVTDTERGRSRPDSTRPSNRTDQSRSADGISGEHTTEDDDGPSPVDRIHEVGTTLLDLADQVREVEATVDATESARTTLDVVGLLTALTDSLELQHPEADVTLNCPGTAWVSAVDIVDSAFDNLLENAVVHSHREHPTVEVTVREADEHVEIVVADDGPGIPDQELATFRAGRETQLTHSSGFGLWLVVWLVEESGGSVEFDIDETGTAVTVRLPAADPPR